VGAEFSADVIQGMACAEADETGQWYTEKGFLYILWFLVCEQLLLKFTGGL